MGLIFPGKVEAFSVFRIIFASGVVTTIILNIALDSLPGWVFLTVILVIQMLTSILATQIMDLKGNLEEVEEKGELLTVSESDQAD